MLAPPDPPPPEGVVPPAFVDEMMSAIPGAVGGVSYWVADWTLLLVPTQLVASARHLRDAAGAEFDFCSDITAVDWPERPDRFDIVYSLFSNRLKHRVRLKVRVAEAVASVSGVWPAANWLEREVFDLFGVRFEGHPDLRRILMPDDWQGHPQRKDYPLEGPGELLMENPMDWLRLRQGRDIE